MPHGRLEARMTFSANQTGTYTDSNGGPEAWTVTAGSYYIGELLSALVQAVRDCAGAVGDDFIAGIDDGEVSTGAPGRISLLSTASGPWSLAWTSTDIRDALGFTGNISNIASLTSATGTNCAKGLWIPNAPAKFSMYGDSANGTFVSDARFTTSLTGRVRGFYGSGHREHRGIRWTGVTGARALDHLEDTSGESFENFWMDCVTGCLSYLPAFPYVRLYWDADDDADYAVGRIAWPATFDLEQMVRGWTGRYNIDLPPLVVEA